MASEISTNGTDLEFDFEAKFNISQPVENDTIRQHPKFHNCHPTISVAQNVQNKRREEFLENLKKKREDNFNKMRRLIGSNDLENEVDCCPTVKDEQIKCEDSPIEPMECVNEKGKNNNKNQRNQRRKDFRKLISDKFMLSEWLVDIPEDFFQNWYMVCCPKGRRTLVVASNGRTKVYTRTGHFLFQFQSVMPGGCHRSNYHVGTNKNSMLDCIYVESEQAFYILDVIVWNGCTFYDCDTEFRFYWIHNNINNELKKSRDIDSSPNFDTEMTNETFVPKSIINYKFKPLDYWSCTLQYIISLYKEPCPFETPIDGILFYHKKTPYTPGLTPLVCWLKVPMIPKIFNISQ